MPDRLLIVSNRLPVTAAATEHGMRLDRAAGGLVAGLGPWHEESDGLWIGWPGDVSRLSSPQRTQLTEQLAARRIVPIGLSRDQVDRFYDGFCNRVLWPLFHYLIDRVPVDAAGWEGYREVNESFAETVAREHRTGDTIWVHDYHLMLLPALLRKRLPHARIGFFLHIPFPSSEVFRILPWRRQVLDGMLGADLVGFHTFAYMRHFVASLLHVGGVEADIDRVRLDDREVRLGVFPMGVDAAHFGELAADREIRAEADEIRRDAAGRQIVLGVDRLDYTKGIPRRLQAVAHLLESNPGLRDRMRYIQVAVPSRGSMDSYQRFKRLVEERVGSINGSCGTLRSAPVHYLHRSVSQRELVSLYLAADVMLVTPLRDGMNLVAKEFVASRIDGDGVLILSEFAGAAAELDGSVVVNPYDVESVARSLQDALSMPDGERRARMKALRKRVEEQNFAAWANGFLGALTAAHPATESLERPGRALVSALGDAHAASGVRLLLDYDGTLVPFARAPELAAPDDELLGILGALAGLPGVRLDIVSGRPREVLEAWFGHLPLGLWAEHGFWRRPSPQGEWAAAAPFTPEPLARIRQLLDQFTAATPGSLLEIKTASLAWHYRGAQREFGSRQAHELRMLLGDALSNQPFEVLEGHRVIEIRLRGVSKAVVAHHANADVAAGIVVIALGDDRTDDDLFRALHPSAITIAVGSRPVAARYGLEDHRAVRQMLRRFIDARERVARPAAIASGGTTTL